MDDLLPSSRAVRIHEIKAILGRDGAISTAALAKTFNKTPTTIRRDLLILENEGLVKRTHGGATALDVHNFQPSAYDIRKTEHPVQKSAIARKAIDFIHDGDSLILNAGTTTHELALLLKQYTDLQVVTNGLTIAAELSHCRGISAVMIGGEIDFKKMGTVGTVAEREMEDIHVSKAFLGLTAISISRGISMHSQAGARVIECFVRSADEVTILADSSKFESHSLFQIASLSDVDRVITDDGIQDKTRQALETMDLELVVVEI